MCSSDLEECFLAMTNRPEREDLDNLEDRCTAQDLQDQGVEVSTNRSRGILARHDISRLDLSRGKDFLVQAEVAGVPEVTLLGVFVVASMEDLERQDEADLTRRTNHNLIIHIRLKVVRLLLYLCSCNYLA